MTEEATRTIGIYIPNFSGGGAEAVSVRLANQLAASGRRVDIIVNQAVGVFRDQVSSEVRIVDLGAGRTIGALLPLVRYLRTNNPSSLIAGLLYNNLLAILARLFSRWRGRLVVCQHNTFSLEARQNSKDRLFSAIFARAMRSADAIVAVSAGVAQDLAQSAGVERDRIEVIYNPIITEDFEQRAAIDPAHPWLATASDPVFVAVGRLTPQKDYPTLLSALSIARRTVPIRIIILGEGTLLDDLRRQAERLGVHDAVDFVGFKSNPLPYMRRSKGLVLTSTFEGFGNVLAEALACGTPVISTACNGPVEVLDHGRHGKLVPIGDASAIADAMLDLLKHPPERAGLVAAADRFRSDLIARQYLAVALGKK
jgi:glycosyltransferase involved in cell wall biosynthesis